MPPASEQRVSPVRSSGSDDPAARDSRWGLTLAQLWTVVAIGLPVLGSLIAPMSTVDLAYQVRAGQWMLENGSILAVDPFTFTVGGEPWLNQQWAAGLLFGAGYEAAGWTGLSIMRAILIGLIFGLVLVACRASGASARTAALLTIASFAVSVASLTLRAQLLGMLLFAGTLAILALRDHHPRLPWLLPVLFVAWASIHGSYVIGLAAVGVAVLADVVAHRGGAGRLAVVLGLCAIATLLNPFGPGVWGYAFSLTTSSQIARLITEWQPTSLRSYTGIAFAASAVAMAFLLVRRGRSVAWPVLLWLAGLFVLGLYAERGVAWWALGAAPVAATMLAGTASPWRSAAGKRVTPGALSAVGDGSAPARPDRRRPVNLAVAAILGIATLVALPTWRGGDAVYGPDGLLLDAPQGVTDALRGVATANDRLYASQHWASWFELAVPGIPVMVDSRIELFPDHVWTDHLAVRAGRSDWAQILDRWGVTLVAVDRQAERNLLPFLAASPTWSLVRNDEDGAVYVRPGPP